MKRLLLLPCLLTTMAIGPCDDQRLGIVDHNSSDGGDDADAHAPCCPAAWLMYSCTFPDGGAGLSCHNPDLGCASSLSCGAGCDTVVSGSCGPAATVPPPCAGKACGDACSDGTGVPMFCYPNGSCGLNVPLCTKPTVPSPCAGKACGDTCSDGTHPNVQMYCDPNGGCGLAFPVCAPPPPADAGSGDTQSTCCPDGWLMYSCAFPDGATGLQCHNPALGCGSSVTCGVGCDKVVDGRCSATP